MWRLVALLVFVPTLVHAQGWNPGDIIIPDKALLGVDPATGDRTVVSGCANNTSIMVNCTGTIIGGGITATSFDSVGFGEDGALYVTSFSTWG